MSVAETKPTGLRTKEKKPYVFLSSVFRDTFDGEFKYSPLRRRIIENRHKLPVGLWAYEHFWPEGSENPTPDADTTVDRCFDGVRDCDLFVFLLSHRHGSGVSYLHSGVAASYLELELLAASLLQKPIIVLHVRGQEPEEPLLDAMEYFKIRSSSLCFIDDEDGLYQLFLSACDALMKRTLLRSEPREHLPDWLSVRRTRSKLEDDLINPPLHFLNGRFASSNTADTSRTLELLAQVTSGVRGAGASERLLPHGAAIFRLWAAMRELMGNEEQRRMDPSVAALWDRCLGLWAGKASWFGLHGHARMGPLAAVNSQLELRARFASEPGFRLTTDVREPLGARASAIYSIAGRMRLRERKVFHYKEVVTLATRAIDRDTDAQQGALSIRGHARMQLAQLGRLWNLAGAAQDFTRSLELRKHKARSSASVGEAMVDLGFCLIFAGRRTRGLALLQEGVELLRSGETADGKAFLVMFQNSSHAHAASR